MTETTAAEAATTTAAAETPAEEVTIEWWHIQNTEPMLSVWQEFADEFMEANPNVQINITVMENEAFKAALQTNLQAGDVPDLFQSWGGGGAPTTGRRRSAAGHHRRVVRLHGDPQRGCRRPLQRRWRSVRHPLQPGHGRVLVQHGPVHPGGDRCPAGDMGRVPRGRTGAQVRDHTDSGHAGTGPHTSTTPT